MAIDFNQAKDTIEGMSDKEKQFLFDARAGIAAVDADEKLQKKLTDKGLVRLAKFENVRATNSIDGILTTEDGDKILQTIEQIGSNSAYDKGGIETETVTLTEDGQKREVDTAIVHDPAPGSNKNNKTKAK